MGACRHSLDTAPTAPSRARIAATIAACTIAGATIGAPLIQAAAWVTTVWAALLGTIS